MEAAKRECILVEAAKAFARFGFKKASIDTIAEWAGVGKGTVYLAAESKQDLFYQVLHREVVSWIADVQKVIDPRTPADQLLLLASNQGRMYLEQRPLLRQLLFGEAYEFMPAWRDRLDALVELGTHNAQQILRLGVQQGIFRSDLDVEVTAQLLIDLQLAYFVLHDRPGPEREARIERRGAAAFNLILNGLYLRPTPT